MATPYIQYSDIVAISSDGGYNEHPRLSQQSSAFLLSACLVMRQKWLWQNPINPIDLMTWELINQLINNAESDLMTSFGIGTIIASVVDLDSDNNLLRCNGQTVATLDYSELASVVPANWISGSDIIIPDMDDHGLHGDYVTTGEQFGENTVTLTESEMPSHNHTQNPHIHTEVIPAVTTALGGEIPATASIVAPIGSTTGSATAVNNPTGGGNPHNNIPLSIGVIWYLVAR